MAHDPGNEKQHAAELIDQLDAVRGSAVVPLLPFMPLDSGSRSFAAAPVEQQPVSREEAAALDQARTALDRGQRISHEDTLQEFGLPPR
jgi:hypothetical protein